MSRCLFDDRHHIVFFHDQQVFTVDFDFGAAVFTKQHGVADFDVESTDLAVLKMLAVAYGDYFTLAGLFSSRIRNHNTAGRHAFFFHALDDNPVMKRTNTHF